MSTVDALFQQLRASGKKAFMPFVTAGDPDLEFTSAVIKELSDRHCSLCELGIPYSDPIADGPVIQSSYTRALANKIKLAEILEMAGDVTPQIRMPVVSMVSYAIIYRHGLEQYVSDAKQAGIAGAIVPDLLVEEADVFADICRRQDFNLIQLVTPTTPPDRARRIAETSTGFLYYVSVTGITGERNELPPELLDNVARLRGQTDLPICIGFGISQAEHVRMLAPVADGLIVGSAIVRRIARIGERSRADVLADVGQYVTDLMNVLAD